MSPPLSCLLTLNECLLDIIPTLDCGLFYLSAGPRAPAFVPDSAVWPLPSGLFTPSPGSIGLWLRTGHLAAPEWDVEARTLSLPPSCCSVSRALSSLQCLSIYKAVKMQRRRRQGGEGKAKIEKVWDRRFRSSACCERLEYYFYFSLS